MVKMRNARRDEYDEIFNLLVRVFNYEKFGYDLTNTKRWFNALDTSNILVMEEGGKIVSHVLIKPYRMRIRGSIIEGAEVGAVATDEEYRGRGFASTLLKEALRRMAERCYDISTLGGYRDRYARFGWENGGAVCTYTISSRSVRYAGDSKDLSLERYGSSDSTMRRKIIKAYEENEAHTIRSEVEHHLTYDIPMYLGTDVWIAHRSDGCFAYAMIRGKEGSNRITVLEYGGDPQTLALLLRRIFEERNVDEITIPSPNWFTKFTPFLERMSESWWVSPVRQINIINLNDCLEKILPSIVERKEEILRKLSDTYSVTLRIRDSDQEATILFDHGCSLTDGKGEEELSLDRCKMVRLLFGPSRPSERFDMSRRMASYLDLIFPFPFYEWATDMV
ncbi:MAG: GNAT family N-acetyltransferase [Thermoproteota archaeon]